VIGLATDCFVEPFEPSLDTTVQRIASAWARTRAWTVLCSPGVSMADDLLRTFGERQCPPNKALKLRAVDYFRLPSGIGVVVEKIPVVDKVA